MTVDIDALEQLAVAAVTHGWLDPALADVRRWLYTRTYGVETTYVNSRGEVYGGLCWKANVEMDSDQARADAQGPYIAAASPDVVLALIERVRAAESLTTLAPREAELCSQAIGVWTSEYNDTPDELTALRVKLLTIAGGAR